MFHFEGFIYLWMFASFLAGKLNYLHHHLFCLLCIMLLLLLLYTVFGWDFVDNFIIRKRRKTDTVFRSCVFFHSFWKYKNVRQEWGRMREEGMKGDLFFFYWGTCWETQSIWNKNTNWWHANKELNKLYLPKFYGMCVRMVWWQCAGQVITLHCISTITFLFSMSFFLHSHPLFLGAEKSYRKRRSCNREMRKRKGELLLEIEKKFRIRNKIIDKINWKHRKNGMFIAVWMTVS